MRKVEYIETSSGRVGQRIDNFLLTYLKGLPRARVYRIVRKGEVRVNKKRVKPAYRLQLGDMVRIPPVALEASEPVAVPDKSRLLWLESCILYECDAFLVINKPAGIPVHGGTAVHFGLIDALRVLRPARTELGLVHRLDKDTSGCLIVAKDRGVLRAFHRLFLHHDIEKEYTALVDGHWDKPSCYHVDAPLLKGRLSSGEHRVRVDNAGKLSHTAFRLVKRFDGASLLRVQLLSGRTHQIRVHAAHMGHPIAQDAKYGEAVFNRRMRVLGLRRIFLHASRLRFISPVTGRACVVEAPLSGHLCQCLNKLT